MIVHSGVAARASPGATENQDSENGQDGGDSISVTLADNTKIVGQPFASNQLVEESPVIQEPATAVRALTLLNQAGSIRGSSTHTP